jgi:RNA polymerase sigma-70 factor (sigma-E family)
MEVTMPSAALPEEHARTATRTEEFESWMAARQRRLLHLAFLLTGDVHTAEDLVQTTLAKLYLAWDRVDRQGNVDAYARKILTNEHASLWRRPWKRRELSSDDLARDFGRHEPHAHDPQYDGTGTALWAAVRSLPPRQRTVIALRYYEQLTEAETAATLGISVGTVKSQASRAIATLRTRLGDQIDGWEDVR